MNAPYDLFLNLMTRCLTDSIIAPVDELPLNRFAELLAESEDSGYRFLRRVVDEWESGANRFSRPDEALLIAELRGRWVGVCGLSIDPYLEDHRVGRVRSELREPAAR